MAATFQNLSGGRLLLNVVTGGESHEQRGVRRLPRQGRPLRALRRVPARRTPPLGGRDRRLRGRAPPRRGRQARRSPDPHPRDLLRRLVAGRGHRRRQARRRLPHLGRAAGRRRREDRLDPRARRGRGPRGPLRHPACTPSPATPPRRPGPRPTGCSTASTTRPSRRSRRACAAASPRASAGCSSCTAAARTTSRSTPTSGPASAWSAAAPAPPWSAATRRSPTGSRSTPTSASTSSSSPATRTSRASTGSARACCRCSPSAACGPHPYGPETPRRPGPVRERARPGGVVTRRGSRSSSATPSRLPHPRGRGPPRHASSPARSRTWSSTSPTSAPGSSTGPTPAWTRWSSRWARPTWSWSPARRTRPPTPACSSCSSTGSRRPACAAWSRSR